MTEDLYREAGFMLPQSKNTKDFLKNLLQQTKDETLKKDIEKLIDLLDFNE